MIVAALFVVAQLADLFTALMVARELNAIVAAGLQPATAVVVKVALIGFVLAIVHIASPTRRVLARVGIVAGAFGTLSNTHLTPFWV